MTYLFASHVEVIQFFVTAYIDTNELVDKTDNQIILSVYPYSHPYTNNFLAFCTAITSISFNLVDPF